MFKNVYRNFNLPKICSIMLVSSFCISKKNLKIKCEVVEEIDDEYFVADIKKFMKNYYLSPNSKKHSFVLFSGNGNRELSQEVAKDLKATLGRVTIDKRDNGESFINIHENINNRNVIIIQTLNPHINDNLMELMFLISALKRESAKKVIVVTPYFAYSRNTVSNDSSKVIPHAASAIIRLLEGLGVDQVIAIELHSKSITGFSKFMPIIDLDMVYVGASYFLEKIATGEISSNPVVISPDVNGAVRARKMKDILEISGVPAKIGFMNDCKALENQNNITYIGDNLEDKDVIIIDDMIHTGTKLSTTVKQVKQMGGRKVYAFITHNLLYPQSFMNLKKLPITELVTTNTIFNNYSSDMITTLSVSKIISKYIEELISKMDSYENSTTHKNDIKNKS